MVAGAAFFMTGISGIAANGGPSAAAAEVTQIPILFVDYVRFNSTRGVHCKNKSGAVGGSPVE